MATKKYRVDTDKGSFIVEVEEPTAQSIEPMLGRKPESFDDTPTSAKEPETWGGGFIKGLKDYGSEQLSSMRDRLGPGLGRLAAPTNLSDIVGLALPSTLGGLRTAAPAAKAAIQEGTPILGQALEGVGDAAKSFKVTQPLKPLGSALRWIGGKMQQPSNAEAISDFHGGPKPAPVGPGKVTVMESKPDLIDRYKETPPNVAEELGLTPKAPNLEPDFGSSNPHPDPRGGGPIASGQEMPTRFNDLPLEEQMGSLPDSGPMPEGRPSSPPPRGEEPPSQPFNEKPLYQQMEEMDEAGLPTPDPRGGGPIASGREVVRRSPADVRMAPKPSTTLEEELTSSLSQREPELAGTTAPEPTITDGGPFKQSGKFSKSESLGQPGGYSSGRPSTTPQQFNDIDDAIPSGESITEPGAADVPESPEASFAPTTSKSRRTPRSTVPGAEAYSENDVSSLEDALSEMLGGQRPRITRLAPTAESDSIITAGRKNRASAYRSNAEADRVTSSMGDEPADLLGAQEGGGLMDFLSQLLRNRGG